MGVSGLILLEAPRFTEPLFIPFRQFRLICIYFNASRFLVRFVVRGSSGVIVVETNCGQKHPLSHNIAYMSDHGSPLPRNSGTLTLVTSLRQSWLILCICLLFVCSIHNISGLHTLHFSSIY